MSLTQISFSFTSLLCPVFKFSFFLLKLSTSVFEVAKKSNYVDATESEPAALCSKSKTYFSRTKLVLE